MNIGRMLKTVDIHMGGESYRFITDGLPPLPGETMAQKMVYMENNYDYLRSGVMCAPRGYTDMFGGVITEPVSDNADCGAFYMGAISDIYYPMCGTCIIAIATMLINLGMVELSEPYTKIVIDTPAGQVNSKVYVKDGQAVEVSYINVPAFIYKKDLVIDTDTFGKIKVDIGNGGGKFCAFIDTEKIDYKLKRDKINDMIKPALNIIEKVNNKIECRHPEKPKRDYLDGCMFCDWDGKAGKELLILGQNGKGLIGRCPCGTATSVRMIIEHDKGILEIGEEFIQKSMIGTKIRGKIIEKTKIGDIKAYISKITGSAYLTGIHELIFEDEDPLKYGYIL